MKTTIYILPDALKSLILANVAGPNCNKNISDLAKLYETKDKLNIEDIAPFFDANFGPVSLLINYAVTELKRKNPIINIEDIVKLYAWFHKSIVKVSRHIFFNNGFLDEYFQILKENGFVIKDENIYDYLFSCFGKVATVINVKNKFITLEVDNVYRKIILDNVYSVIKVSEGDKVAVHFGGVFAKIDDKTFFEIDRHQDEYWFSNFKKIKKIDYRFFLGSNLTKFTESEMQRLP